MNKLLILYRNEMSRTFRKASTLFILGLIILICILVPPLFNLMVRNEMSDSGETVDNFKSSVAQLNAKIKGIDEQLSNLEDSGKSELTRTTLLEEKFTYEDMIGKYDYLLSAGYEDDSSTDLIILASEDLLSYLKERRRFENKPAEEMTVLEAEYSAFLNNAIETVKELPKTLNFPAYIDVRKKDVEFQQKFYALLMDNGADSNRDALNSLKLRIDNAQLYTRMYEEFLIIDPKGGIDRKHDFRETQTYTLMIQDFKNSLQEGVYRDIFTWSDEPQPLTNARRKWIEDSMQIVNYQIASDNYSDDLDSMIASMSKFYTVTAAKFVMAVLLIMIAGATISQEIATGSIKSLIIAPVRRWKIFISKWMVILTIFLLALVMISVLSDLVTVAVCGSGSLSDYTYIGSQGVRTMPFYMFNLLSLMAESVDILFVMVISLMLSSLLRNTALSVALSVGLYATIGIYNTGVMEAGSSQMSHKFFQDFIPFNNFNLVSDLFQYRIYSVSGYTAELVAKTQSVPRPGLLFSSIYLLLVLSCFFLIAMDSFTRRDIK